MKATCPRLVIAGTGSGVGKTSIALGLARALSDQGLRVQTFKVGPDFLDPTHLAVASGRTCYNLDGWMTSQAYVRQLFARTTAEADIAIIEGVMGLFDGATARTLEGSTAEIALWLDAPVLLIVDAHGVARSLAATVKGFVEFQPGLRVAGVIANQGGSPRHRAWLAESLSDVTPVPLVGMLARGSLPSLPSRHLGLVAAEQAGVAHEVYARLAAACAEQVDLAAIVALARSAGSFEVEGPPLPPPESRRIRVGLARDEAFSFYYPDNLELLAHFGVEWVPFSPLSDSRLPEDLAGLYLGGGYPELHAERLAANFRMREDIRRFATSGRVVYAECGGLMYLGQTLTTHQGVCHPMVGVVPIHTAMLPRIKTLRYAEVCWATDTIWGRAGETARGHEFHYSEIIRRDESIDRWQPAYHLRGRGDELVSGGFCNKNVIAGYVHLHWASRPESAHHFVESCENGR